MSGFADLEAVARDAENVWAADASVRAEFGSKEIYLAFRKAEARGMCKVLGRARDASHQSVAPVTPADPEAATKEAERTWAADASVRAEFHDKAAYLAFRRADARASVSIFGRRPARTTGSGTSADTFESAENSLTARQAQVRQENVGRQFAGLPLLDVPQQ